jgi:hypothetical protein
MAYTVNVFPIDPGGFIGLGPALNGTFVNVLPATGTDVAVASAAATFTLTFMTATPPPPPPPMWVVALHITNTGPTGDLFRSGYLGTLPTSPGTLTLLSFPTGITRIPATTIAARAAALAPIILVPPGWVAWLMGALSLGTYIPIRGAILTITAAVNTPPGSMTFTVTGFFTFQTYYFFTDTIGFTGTLVATPTPSGDVVQTPRILAVPATTSLATTTTGPSPTLALTGLFLSLVAPAVAAVVQPQLEMLINGEIDKLVAPGLASQGFLRSPTSVVSARNVTITGSGVVLSLVLGDINGPAVTRRPGRLNVAISPPPEEGKQDTYTVTVTDSAAGSPVDQADVTLQNFTSSGVVQALGPLKTNSSGQLVFSVTLHPKVTYQVDPISHDRIRHFAPPTLTLAKTGYSTVNLTLLEDTGDV